MYNNTASPQTTPTTTVALKLHSASPTSPTHPSTPSSKLSAPPSPLVKCPCAGFKFVRYSSDRSADDFHPHDCETVKLSGADAKRISAVPSAEEQHMEKYACCQLSRPSTFILEFAHPRHAARILVRPLLSSLDGP